MSLDEHLEEIIRKVVREELHNFGGGVLENLLTADETAVALSCGKQTVYRLRREGHLKAVMVSETQMGFAPEEVRRFINAGGVQSLPREQDAA